MSADGPEIQVVRLSHGADLPLPAYASAGAAGADLHAALAAPLALEPGATAAVPTGLQLALPPGYEAQIRPRSGLAAKFGVTVLNAPGTIDSDYRGEVQVLLVNLGQQTLTLAHGERIAQMVVAPIARAGFTAAAALSRAETARGTGGFGSTGTAPGGTGQETGGR